MRPLQSRHSVATEMFQQTIVAPTLVNLLQKGSLCNTAHTSVDVKANHWQAFDSDPLAILQPLGTTQFIKQNCIKAPPKGSSQVRHSLFFCNK